MWDAPEQESPQDAPSPSFWLVYSQAILVAVVLGALFTVAPRVPNGSAEAGLLFGAALVLASIATLRFLVDAADYALRE